MATQRARLIAADFESDLELEFALNPRSIERAWSSRYADVALARHDGNPQSPGELSEWGGNSPDKLTIEFMLYSVEAGKDVEREIGKIDRMRRKDSRTGEPPDMIFVFGNASDTVRVETVNLSEKLHAEDGKRQQVDVRMGMRLIRGGG